ncbi:MAG: hypothetical protein ACREMH_10130 [Gemmatimonadales bacterium]
MDPALSGFALGLLVGAAKVFLIGTVGFGIAWWRTRRRLQVLEAEHARPSITDERLDRLEQGFDYLASQLDRLVEGQGELARQLNLPEAHPRELPSGSGDSASTRERAEPITPR